MPSTGVPQGLLRLAQDLEGVRDRATSQQCVAEEPADDPALAALGAVADVTGERVERDHGVGELALGEQARELVQARPQVGVADVGRTPRPLAQAHLAGELAGVPGPTEVEAREEHGALGQLQGLDIGPVGAQHLLAQPQRPGGVAGVAEHLGAVGRDDARQLVAVPTAGGLVEGASIASWRPSPRCRARYRWNR